MYKTTVMKIMYLRISSSFLHTAHTALVIYEYKPAIVVICGELLKCKILI